MLVYRLEKNDKGVFCFSSGISDDDISYTKDSIYGTNGCSTELRFLREDYRFACESIESLIDYFGSDFAVMLGAGAEIKVYKVRKNYIKYGNGFEIAFPIAKAERLN